MLMRGIFMASYIYDHIALTINLDFIENYR